MTTANTRLGRLALGVLLVACSPKPPVVLPEMRILVTDESGRPLAGIPIWYGVESEVYSPPILGVLPRDGVVGARFIVKQSAVTPANGEIVIPPRTLQLGKTEHFRYEHIYANASVDAANRVARIARTALEHACAELSSLCPTGGNVQEIEIANQVWQSPNDRAQALRPANARYGVVRVLVVEPARQKLFESKQTDPVFSSRTFGSDRSRPETMRIELPGR